MVQVDHRSKTNYASNVFHQLNNHFEFNIISSNCTAMEGSQTPRHHHPCSSLSCTCRTRQIQWLPLYPIPSSCSQIVLAGNGLGNTGGVPPCFVWSPVWTIRASATQVGKAGKSVVRVSRTTGMMIWSKTKVKVLEKEKDNSKNREQNKTKKYNP